MKREDGKMKEEACEKHAAAFQRQSFPLHFSLLYFPSSFFSYLGVLGVLVVRLFSVPLLVIVLASPDLAAAEPPIKTETAESSPPIRVAVLTYASGKTSKCFAAGFLDDVARQTHIKVERQFQSVALDSADLFNFPFVVLTGEGDFTLKEEEVKNLRAYLQRGGFLLASAGCSSPEWTAAFRRALKQVLPDIEAKAVPMEHAMFHTLYDIQPLRSKAAVKEAVEIEGLEVDGRLAVVFSPYGLNDTANAGGNCCCCGGNEVRNAHLINADILAYALTH